MHGSKSVSLGRIIAAYANAVGSGSRKELAQYKKEIELEKKHAAKADKLHTTLHKVVGARKWTDSS